MSKKLLCGVELINTKHHCWQQALSEVQRPVPVSEGWTSFCAGWLCGARSDCRTARTGGNLAGMLGVELLHMILQSLQLPSICLTGKAVSHSLWNPWWGLGIKEHI